MACAEERLAGGLLFVDIEGGKGSFRLLWEARISRVTEVTSLQGDGSS